MSAACNPCDTSMFHSSQPPEELSVIAVNYLKAKEFVIQHQQCSVPFIQRKLNIGYIEASVIVGVLEANGIVGPPTNSQHREVLISKRE